MRIINNEYHLLGIYCITTSVLREIHTLVFLICSLGIIITKSNNKLHEPFIKHLMDYKPLFCDSHTSVSLTGGLGIVMSHHSKK